ncbi:MAG: hypothetical protein M5U15_15470 [Kiritimatiellae bacterium]|nr:hypothetical protein [Kiritimatiellia bacterium]
MKILVGILISIGNQRNPDADRAWTIRVRHNDSRCLYMDRGAAIHLLGYLPRNRLPQAPSRYDWYWAMDYAGITRPWLHISIYHNGGLLNQREIGKAKKYCEQLAVRLDQMKEQSGLYPTNLVGMIEQTDIPRILKDGNLYYHSQGTNYSITFSDPGGMMNGWDFIGNTRKWSRFD